MIKENMLSWCYRHLPVSIKRNYAEKKRCVLAALAQKHSRRKARSYGTFSSGELRECLRDLGVREGANIMVQSSLSGMDTYRGRSDEIVDVLLELIGNKGTLCMPSYPKQFGREVEIFDVRKTPSDAGMISELFRRTKSVIRSLQPTHTVCALGPDAEYLTKDHHLSPFPFGEKSPWCRIADINGLLVGLGLPEGYTTVWHTVEDLLYPKFPVEVYYPQARMFLVRGYDGIVREIAAYVHCPQPKVDHARFLNYLSSEAHKYIFFHGVPIFVTEANSFLSRMIKLAKEGKTKYD